MRVTWVDSATPESRWTSIDEFRMGPHPMYSVGYVWKVDSESVAIAPHIDEGMYYACGIIIIPICSITRVEKLRCP